MIERLRGQQRAISMVQIEQAVPRQDVACVLHLIIAPLNRFLVDVPAQPKLVSEGGRFVHELPGDVLEEPVRPVIRSLTALLASDDACRVGCCHAPGCGWFLVDESPNHTRQWCSSEVCGNRARARRACAKRKIRRS